MYRCHMGRAHFRQAPYAQQNIYNFFLLYLVLFPEVETGPDQERKGFSARIQLLPWMNRSSSKTVFFHLRLSNSDLFIAGAPRSLYGCRSISFFFFLLFILDLCLPNIVKT